MYKFKTEEFDLTEQEQEKARFLIEVSRGKNEEWSKGTGSLVPLERAAFEQFKRRFYSDLQLRLKGYPADFPSGNWSISDDGAKAIEVTVVRE